jgi:AraC-like DNA-binding protein
MDLTCEERASDSPFIERVWRSRSEHGGPFISVADSHWEMVVTRLRGRIIMTVRGPETRATPAYGPADAEFFGIQFKAGAFMPKLPAKMVMDRRDLNLPSATSQSFWLNGSTWQFPDFDNAETFVDWLVRDDLLVSDPVVGAVLQGQPVKMSLRTVQRRFLQATGLRHGTVYQIQRARYATALLKQGVPILDTVYRAGYFDQAHLTRSLKRLIGLTPAQISSRSRPEVLSFLYNTTPLFMRYDTNVPYAQREETTCAR